MQVHRHPAVIAALLTAASVSAPASTSTLYVSDVSANLWRVDPVSGVASLIGNTGAQMRDIAISAAGAMYGCSFSEELFSINPSTAQSQRIGSLGVPICSGLEFDAQDNLFLAAGTGSRVLYTVNLSTGAVTRRGDMGFGAAGDLAFEPSTGLLYLSTGSPSVGLARVNPTSGAGTYVGSHGFVPLTGMDFVGSDLLGLCNPGMIVRLNVVTGQGTLLAQTSPSINVTGATYFQGCLADFNADGIADFFDYLDFVAAFDAEDPAADFNGDQTVDFFDYLDFVAAFDAGCD
jgi:hypothetical protein